MNNGNRSLLVSRGISALDGVAVGGFLKQSFIDYPGKISAVIYTAGCNLRCIYCHNPELVLPESIRRYGEEDVEAIVTWLVDNRALLDAVVVTGGEPLMHGLLPGLLRWVRELGLAVKIDTNGTFPDMLEAILLEGLADYVALDLKAPLDYEKQRMICGKVFTHEMLDALMHSLRLVKRREDGGEIRTTLLKPYHLHEDVLSIMTEAGCLWKARSFRAGKTLQNITAESFTEKEILSFSAFQRTI